MPHLLQPPYLQLFHAYHNTGQWTFRKYVISFHQVLHRLLIIDLDNPHRLPIKLDFSKILHMHGMCAPSPRRHAKRRSPLLRLNQTAGATMLCVPFARKLLRHAKKLPLPASQMVLL